MTYLSILVYITQAGHPLRRGYSRRFTTDDVIILDLFSRALMGQEKHLNKLAETLNLVMPATWTDTYDFVNPFGDQRGSAFESVWTFDLDKDMLFLTKNDRFCSTSLKLARERLLTLDDFELLSSHRQPLLEEQTLPGPRWKPELDIHPRTRSFLGKVLRDFTYAWRHVLRRRMNTTTFIKLAYAIIWISTLEFTILDRMGFHHSSGRGNYVNVTDLPSWETPQTTLVQVGQASWFAIAEDTREGLEIVRCHAKCHSRDVRTYAIMTHRYIILCKVHGGEIVWTRPEALFEAIYTSSAIDMVISNTAVDMILWLANTTDTGPQPSAISLLPLEIQDMVLYSATTNLVASAKLGCELGLGSPFYWAHEGVKISVQGSTKHPSEYSHVESMIAFNGVRSGLSYQIVRLRTGRPPASSLWSTYIS